MQTLRLLRRAAVYIWQGPTDLPRSLKLEWRFVAIRWLGIFFIAPSLLLANLPDERLLAAYAVLVVAAIYNLVLQWVMPKRPLLFASGYLTMLGDTLLNIAMVTVGGGLDSPFYYILFTTTISTAMRYGYGPSLGIALIYVSFDAFEQWPVPQPLDAPFVFRSLILCLTVILASYLREQAHRAEAALQERLRQANLLNEATATLGVSLEFKPVLNAVAAAAAHLFNSPSATLWPARELNGDVQESPAMIHYPSGHSSPLHTELGVLCRHYAGAASGQQRPAQLYYRDALPSGLQAIVLVLSLPTRHVSLATLALVAQPAHVMPPLDADILESFVERITLAIENASLYRTLASRSNDLERAYADLAMAHQELLSVDEMKTSFLANVSHELRTPLSSIRAFSELLLSYREDESVQQEFLEVINSESERLTRLVNDVLDITKIESGDMDWQMRAVDPAALLRDSARTYGTLVERQGLRFEQAIDQGLPAAIYADSDRLHQVVSNLLNNALKFTAQGAIRLGARRVGDEIHISVSDTGIGIALEDQERIFEKFQQVGAMLTDKPHGTGLGLAICRDIVAHHNGRLWVESQPGAGSTFVFSLDAASPPEALQGVPHRPEQRVLAPAAAMAERVEAS